MCSEKKKKKKNSLELSRRVGLTFPGEFVPGGGRSPQPTTRQWATCKQSRQSMFHPQSDNPFTNIPFPKTLEFYDGQVNLFNSTSFSQFQRNSCKKGQFQTWAARSSNSTAMDAQKMM